MKVLVIGVSLLCTTLLSAAQGYTAFRLGRTQGPDVIYRWMVLWTGFAIALSVLVTWLVAGECKIKARYICIIAAITGGAASVITPLRLVVVEKQRISFLLKGAPAVTQCGLRYFKQIDRWKDGDLTRLDLKAAIADETLREERATLKYILAHLEEIGHVIDACVSTGSSKRPPLFAWKGQIYNYRSGKFITYLYGISREDLQNYEARLLERYKDWL
jgi:hypothetical protein